MRKRAGPIAYFVPHLEGGGAERVALEIIRQLIRRGIAVDLIVTRSGGEMWNSIPAGARVVNLKAWKIESNSLGVLTSLPALVRYLKRRRPAVLISTLGAGNVVTLIVKKYFLRDLKLIARHENCFSLQRKYAKIGIYYRLLKWLFPVADSVVAVSNDAAEDMRNCVPLAAKSITYVPNPVVTAALFEQARIPLKHTWLDDPTAPVIIASGILGLQKDFPTLLRAFTDLRRSRNARLIILGRGPDKSQLVNLAQELGIQTDVEFPGFQSNPFAYISKSQVFVLSSLFEGLPTVLIEALACGTPVVATDCLTGPREILEGGKWGTLTPVGDWKAMSKAIQETLDNPPNSNMLIAAALRYSSTAAMNQQFKMLRQFVDPDDLKYGN